MDFTLKFLYADDAQEKLKGDVVKNRERAQEVFNSIYTEVMNICKVAQRYFKDDPVTHNKFTFSKVVENMNAAPKSKKEETIDTSSELQHES